MGCAERSYIAFFIERITQLQAFHGAHECIFKFVRYFLGDSKSFRRDAGLSVIGYTRLDAGLDGFLKIRTGHDDERIAAAEFEDNFFNSFCRARSDLDPGALAAR